MKNAVFWDVTPFGSYMNRRFGGKYHPSMRVAQIGELGTLAVTSNIVFLRSVRRLPVTVNVVSSSTIRHPDDGGDTFLRNVGCYNSHSA
jgi:hypothetical protein